MIMLTPISHLRLWSFRKCAGPWPFWNLIRCKKGFETACVLAIVLDGIQHHLVLKIQERIHEQIVERMVVFPSAACAPGAYPQANRGADGDFSTCGRSRKSWRGVSFFHISASMEQFLDFTAPLIQEEIAEVVQIISERTDER